MVYFVLPVNFLLRLPGFFCILFPVDRLLSENRDSILFIQVMILFQMNFHHLRLELDFLSDALVCRPSLQTSRLGDQDATESKGYWTQPQP